MEGKQKVQELSRKSERDASSCRDEMMVDEEQIENGDEAGRFDQHFPINSLFSQGGAETCAPAPCSRSAACYRICAHVRTGGVRFGCDATSKLDGALAGRRAGEQGRARIHMHTCMHARWCSISSGSRLLGTQLVNPLVVTTATATARAGER